MLMKYEQECNELTHKLQCCGALESSLSKNRTEEIDEFLKKLAKPTKPIFVLFVMGTVFLLFGYYWIQAESWFERLNYFCGSVSVMLSMALFFEWIFNDLVFQKKFTPLLLMWVGSPLIGLVGNNLFILSTFIHLLIIFVMYRIKRNQKKILAYEAS
ncbi:MAG: hypothetical protein E6230_24280 [Paenibacillus dendritiformis]|uniref:hypothetical protein n=1 Tax=Paenibacillus dendritiformis TaxID=130049 RepID=UPI00143DC157|nr:hypothetical protein [Paenibacillus dendritiformis]MDU5145300.1 hypothetical protein [Paenibacillus dendritiformis]NKI19975.1 hypothetical protein [Paenibacillus dendritiformis]NRF99991.1 hypothetical protein [Paenibacillus dendritiformis]GIO72475.1 hypothetical protein J27TS7_19890 [Paenibacillus dendritiformis]